ncbi:hypothetical protein F5Y19DRAFT_492784 [Xylariaceae sp. FL1651]|nr:hypothetical protein F5Y19DRAFT_492784 [Xylariaceae sp. FL1651]
MYNLLTGPRPRQGSINKQISRYETTAVFTHPDAKVDIILVHGLNGDPQNTWTAKNGIFWPADLLPTSLREARANILVYGYNADVYSKKHGSSPSDNFIHMHAQTLVTSLTHYRKDEFTSHNPIIWVCHSLGGILVKRALLYSNDLRTPQHEDYRSIYVSTYGMVFLGTPHTGSGIAAWGTVLQAMSDAVIPKPFFQSESVLLRTLKRDNEILQEINNHFLDIYQRFKIFMAHENHKTDFKGTKMLVVDSNSASPQLPGVTYFAIEATHSGMCKFDSKNAPGYRTVATAIREWVVNAPDVITTRWRIEEEERMARAKHDIEERMKPWIRSQRLHQSGQGTSIPQQDNDTTLSKIPHQSIPLLPEPETPNQTDDDEEPFPSQQSRSDHDPAREPIFVRPSVFRPNTYFKGREKEMKLLHKMLTDRKRRSEGTSSVLIQSMPGGGKSHLARQYVFQHRYDYPGGIFWIRAKSIQELEYGYYDIAKVAGLSEANNVDQRQANDTWAVIKAVQAWLSSTQDWLLVLDGIHFDLENLQHYIPFAKHTSIIYTSTERTTGEEYQFDNPQVIALDPLTKREAQELLFEEMGKKKPYTQDDLQRAEELIELMDRLPLMIHVAALHLKATREPLAKYLRSYKSRPKVGNLPAYRAVREQLEHRGAFAALNLMSLLAFFGTHIPVEMIVLGAKALDKRTPVKSSSVEIRRSSLNNTFKILIAFALIERNENNEASSATSRSTRSVDMAQDNLDILRVHGIVQAFFVDVLNEKKEIDFWLERAICVFCSAFDASVHRVDKDPQTGVPEDYRRLLIHGRRLLTHLDRFEKRIPSLGSCRQGLEARLDSIQNRIDQLTKRVSEAASQGSANLIVSIFERTNSLSEGESETPPSNPSLIEHDFSDDVTETLESPLAYNPTGHGPYHWHVPVQYPHGAQVWDTSRTVTPQPAPTEIFESISMPGDDETTRKVFGPDHRTIRKHAERRYRDHAGAWRASPQIISDPRVTISRETVRGFINPPTTQQQGRRLSSSDSGPSVQSEAEISLNNIRRGSPKLRTGVMGVQDPDSPPVRPRLVAGRPSYADAMAEETDGEDYPVTPTFSYPHPSSKDAAAQIIRLKETDGSVSLDGLAPIKVSSPLAAAPMRNEALPSPASPSVQSIIGHDMAAPAQGSRLSPGPSSQPPSRSPSRPPSAPLSRSARSSPSQSMSPFRPPPFPIEINTSSNSLHSLPPTSSRHQNSHRLSTYSIDEDSEYPPLAESLPSIQQPHLNLPYPHTVHVPPESFSMPNPPAPWVASSMPPSLQIQGYSSQPMSRDPSHQSSASHSSSRSLPRAHDSPLALSNQAFSSSPASQIMQRPRSRRPSVVETEPSPRLNAFEIDSVVTSYQLYSNSRHTPTATSNHSPRGRKRGSSTSTAAPMHPSSSTPGFFSRFRSVRARGENRRQRRSESAGARLDSGATDESSQSEVTINHSSPRQMPASEEMERSGSGSGGIRLDKDTIVQFGSPPAQAAAAVAEVAKRSPNAGSSSPGSPPSSSSRAPRRGSGIPRPARGSPPAGVGLGIQQRRAS